MKKELKKFREFRKWFNKHIIKNYGKKCFDFVWTCPACHAYLVKELFDDFVDDLIETEKWLKKETKPKAKIKK